MTIPEDSIVIIGVGNVYRGDDAAGPAVARELSSLELPGVHVVDQIGDGTDLVSAWEGVRAAFVIDSMQSGAEAGAIRRFNALEESIPEDIFPGYSTHAFRILDTMRLAQVIKHLPERLIVFGIEGKQYSTGDAMSLEVTAAVKTVVGLIVREIERLPGHSRRRRRSNLSSREG